MAASNLNERYRQRLALYSRLNWQFGAKAFPGMGNVVLRTVLDRQFAGRFARELVKAHKLLWPGRRKINLDNLPEEVCTQVRLNILPAVDSYVVGHRRMLSKVRQWLYDNAPNVTLEGTEPWPVTFKSDAGDYSTQTDPERYSRAVCLQKASVLESAGIPYEIVRATWNEDYTDYAPVDKYNKASAILLRSPLQPYQLDALERQGPMSNPYVWALRCWNTGTNPKVFNPFLDDEIYERSMRDHMAGKRA